MVIWESPQKGAWQPIRLAWSSWFLFPCNTLCQVRINWNLLFAWHTGWSQSWAVETRVRHWIADQKCAQQQETTIKITWLTNSDLVTNKKQLDAAGSSSSFDTLCKTRINWDLVLGNMPLVSALGRYKMSQAPDSNQKCVHCPKLQLSHLIPCKG